MTNTLQQAQYRLTHQRILLTGIDGAGKTLGGLYLAKGLLEEGKELVVIKTKMEYSYTDLLPFKVIGKIPPHSPEAYIEAINFAIAETPNIGVLMVDSLTPECVYIEEAKDKYVFDTPNADKWACWELFRPRHYAFLKVLMDVPCHVIATATCKEELIVGEGGMVKANGTPILMKHTGGEFNPRFECIPESHHFKVESNMGVFDKKGKFKPLDWDKAGDTLNEQHGKLIHTHIHEQSQGRKSRAWLKSDLTTAYNAHEIAKKWVAYKEETALNTPSPAHLDDNMFERFVGYCLGGITNTTTTENE